jgi:hypothetical protein
MLELWNIFRNRYGLLIGWSSDGLSIGWSNNGLLIGWSSNGLLIGWSNDGLLIGKYLVSAHNQIINASGLHQLNNAPCLH